MDRVPPFRFLVGASVDEPSLEDRGIGIAARPDLLLGRVFVGLAGDVPDRALWWFRRHGSLRRDPRCARFAPISHLWGRLLLIGLAGASFLYKDYQRGPYFVRGKMAEVFAVGSDYRTAVGAYWEQHHAWPERIEDIGLQRSPQSVKAVVLEANGVIRVIASFPPLEGKSLLFVPSVSGGAIQWQCSSEGIPAIHLPSGCRQR